MIYHNFLNQHQCTINHQSDECECLSTAPAASAAISINVTSIISPVNVSAYQQRQQHQRRSAHKQTSSCVHCNVDGVHIAIGIPHHMGPILVKYSACAFMAGVAEDEIVSCSISVKDMVAHKDGTNPDQVVCDCVLIHVYTNPTCQKHRRGWRRWFVPSPTSGRHAAVFAFHKVRRFVEPVAACSALIVSWE